MRNGQRAAIASALAVITLLGIAGCGQATPSGRPKVGLVIANVKLNFANEMGDGFTAGSTDVGGVDTTVVGPEIVDGPAQIKTFQELARTAKGGITVETLTPELLARPLAAAAKDGIPLIALDTAPAPGSGVKLYVGNDNYLLGADLAEEAVRRLPPDASGTVILGTSSPGVQVLDFRAKGMRDVFRTRLPRVRVLGPFDTAQDVPANQIAWQRLVTANPTALAFLGTGDADSFNLAAIRKRTGKKWLAGAFDLDPRALAGVEEGQLFALISPEHFLKGAIAGRLQAQHAKGELALPEGWICTPGLTITSANIDQITRRQASIATRADWFRPQVDSILRNRTSYLRPLADGSRVRAGTPKAACSRR